MDCSEGCPTAAVMFGVPGVRVLAAQREPETGTSEKRQRCRQPQTVGLQENDCRRRNCAIHT